MWNMQNGTPAHFSRTVRSILSNRYRNHSIGTGDPLHGLHPRHI
jgi:hypothetical protein